MRSNRRSSQRSLVLAALVVFAIASPGVARSVTAVGPALFSGGCAPTAQGPLALLGYTYLDGSASHYVTATHVDERRPDACVVRVTLPAGDGGTNRAEFSAPHVQWGSGDDVWYALSFRLDSSFQLPQRGEWTLIHQFFAQNIARGVSGGSPPLALEVTPAGALLLDVRGGVKQTAYDRAPRNSAYWLGDAVANRWCDLLIHVRWSPSEDGLVEVWREGPGGAFETRPLVSARGPNLLTVGGLLLNVYPETGIYRSASSSWQSVDYAGLWARPSRAAAAATLVRG